MGLVILVVVIAVVVACCMPNSKGGEADEAPRGQRMAWGHPIGDADDAREAARLKLELKRDELNEQIRQLRDDSYYPY